jgi:hypothetical protein
MSNREKPQTVKQPFESAELRVAMANCNRNVRSGRAEPPRGANCPACTMRVMLHCFDCKVQVTGCLCTEYKRFGQDEAWKRAVARWGEQAARQRAESAGLWVPPQR